MMDLSLEVKEMWIAGKELDQVVDAVHQEYTEMRQLYPELTPWDKAIIKEHFTRHVRDPRSPGYDKEFEVSDSDYRRRLLIMQDLAAHRVRDK